ncbi:MAG TPA: cellulase family glycosylhydrolase [Cyclobacteriaceae bacterium]|nr:cellulase family glycosylhydrolase [Cyclobacteriaceae bacterium]
MKYMENLSRREFIVKSGIAAAGMVIAGNESVSKPRVKNKLPHWKGFNLLDFFSPNPATQRIKSQDEHFKWMSDWGFDFVRIPMAYPSYLKFDRSRDITPEEIYNIDEEAIDKIDSVVLLAHKYNMHVSLNLHRAPGYCINAGFHEPYNLWKDDEALKAFCYHWNMWAKRYKNVSSEKISFDLVNEPNMREDMNDQHSKGGPVPGEVYRKVAKAAAEEIRSENPGHLVIADGNRTGTAVIPEIVDLNIAQSCRGYNPGIISHYKAPWANRDPDSLPVPTWPMVYNGQTLDREMLEKFYQPWYDILEQGVGVHCGECGCWNKTPHQVFLAWFGDVLSILSKKKIGFALWEFIGTFGILDSGRADVEYEDWHGHKLDRKLLNLILKQ